MINDLLRSVSTIYIAYGVTDFRKQIHSLCDIVQNKYKLNPYMLILTLKYTKTAQNYQDKKTNNIKIVILK